MSWSKGFAEWIDGDNAYLSIAFTWLLDHAFERAIMLRAAGYTVHAGGPALFLVKMRHELADLKDVKLGGDYPEAVLREVLPEACAVLGTTCDITIMHEPAQVAAPKESSAPPSDGERR